YPFANKLESFVIALANMDIAVALRIDRFGNRFFTATDSAAVLQVPPENRFALFAATGGGFTPVDLQQEITGLTNPVAPSGAAIVSTVEDLQAQTRLKAYRALHAVDTTFDLLAHDLLNAAFWLDVRKKQDPTREFGAASTAAWQALRKRVPLDLGGSKPPAESLPVTAAAFIRTTPAGSFYAGGAAMAAGSERTAGGSASP